MTNSLCALSFVLCTSLVIFFLICALWWVCVLSLFIHLFCANTESYGGIYIPMFMDQMQTRGGFPNLKGAAIGDGCWGTKVGLCDFSSGKSQQIQVEFFAGHGMYDQPLYQKLHQECKNFSDHDVTLEGCRGALAEMNDKIGSFDVYNVYDTCGHDTVADLDTFRNAMLNHTVRSKENETMSMPMSMPWSLSHMSMSVQGISTPSAISMPISIPTLVWNTIGCCGERGWWCSPTARAIVRSFGAS